VSEAVTAFIRRAGAGEVTARGGHPFSGTTLTNYAGVLDRHVKPFHVERYGCALGDLRADLVDQKVMQTMADSIAAKGRRESAKRANREDQQRRHEDQRSEYEREGSRLRQTLGVHRSAGQQPVLVTVPPGQVVLFQRAPVRFALVRVAKERFAPLRFALVRFAKKRIAQVRFAPLRFALVRFA
jgi:hypothetical protein